MVRCRRVQALLGGSHLTNIDVDVSDLAGVVAAFERGLNIGMVRSTQSSQYRDAMVEGVARHFRKLSRGGQQTSLDGESIAWSQKRSPTTIVARRIMLGKAKERLPLLICSGLMRDDYTIHARVRVRGRSRNQIKTSYGTNSRISQLKARRNQAGGNHRTFFPALGRIQRVTFPERPFLFWDARMRDNLLKAIKTDIEKAIGEELQFRGSR